jgi:hypothetical protein
VGLNGSKTLCFLVSFGQKGYTFNGRVLIEKGEGESNIQHYLVTKGKLKCKTEKVVIFVGVAKEIQGV